MEALADRSFAWIECRCCRPSSSAAIRFGLAASLGAPSAAERSEGGGSFAVETDDFAAAPGVPACCRFSLLVTRRFGVYVLAPSISEAARGECDRDAFAPLGVPPHECCDAALRSLRSAFGKEWVSDFRHLGPLHIPSGYDDAFNFGKHVLGKIVTRCVSRQRVASVLASAAGTLRTLRGAVEESYHAGQLRRCRAVDTFEERVYDFDPPTPEQARRLRELFSSGGGQPRVLCGSPT